MQSSLQSEALFRESGLHAGLWNTAPVRLESYICHFKLRYYIRYKAVQYTQRCSLHWSLFLKKVCRKILKSMRPGAPLSVKFVAHSGPQPPAWPKSCGLRATLTAPARVREARPAESRWAPRAARPTDRIEDEVARPP